MEPDLLRDEDRVDADVDPRAAMEVDETFDEPTGIGGTMLDAQREGKNNLEEREAFVPMAELPWP